MRVLITQPAQEAAATARALAARGHEPVTIPLVSVEREAAPPINLAGAQGFLATSAEGVRALADHVGVRTFPIFVDSELTAAEARRAGFKEVLAAKDDAQDLARLVERTLKPASGALIHACSTAAPVGLPAMLGNMGFAVRPLPLFSIRRVAEIPRELRERLQSRSVDAALFTSPDEARAFVTLIQRDASAPPLVGFKAVAATPATAAALRALAGISVTVAPASDPDTVWSTLDGELVDRVDQERRARELKAKEEEERRHAAEEQSRKDEENRARLAREKAETDRIERERKEAERAAAEREATARAEIERLAREEELRIRAEEARRKHEQDERERAERLAREDAERERLASERAIREQADRERREKDPIERERLAAEKAARAEAEKRRLAAERAEREEADRKRAREDREERERVKAEEAARRKVEKERLAAEREERDRLRQEREDRERAERVELDRQRAEQYARERAEKERLAAERAAHEKAQREQWARERAARDEAERERLAAERGIWEEAERARKAADKAERDRVEAERLARERSEREEWEKTRTEQERVAREEAERKRAEKEHLMLEREKERYERERLAREEAERIRAEKDRVARERAEAKRLEQEKRAEAERLENERLAAAARLEKERTDREKAELERAEAEEAARNAEQERRAREHAAEKAAREDQERRAAAEAKREEADRLAREQAETRRRQQTEADEAKAERKRLAEEAKAAARAEKARRRAEKPRAPGWRSRLSAWFGGEGGPPPERAPDQRWTMTVAGSDTPTPAAGPQDPASPAVAAVASGPPPWNDVPMTDPTRDSSQTPEPAASEPPSGGDGRVPLALVELNDLVERESAPHRRPDGATDLESLADAKPAARSGGGRSAQMLAEDAADDRAQDRLKNWGRADSPAPEKTPREAEPQPERVQDAVAAPPVRRSGRGRSALLFLVLAAGVGAGMMTVDDWLPLLVGEPEPRPAAGAPAPQTKPAPVTAAPAPEKAPAAAPATAAPVAAASAPPADITLNQTVAALMARIATLEAALGNSVRLGDLDRRVSALEDSRADASSVLALGDRVAALEHASRSAADARADAVALTIAALQWREAIVSGRPFLKEWDTVKALTGDTSPRSDFARYAVSGFPTLPKLRRRFDVAAAAAVRADYLPSDTAPWLRRVMDRVFSVVTIRRIDVDVGDGIEAVLVRAERAADAGDLAQAAAELKKLTGAPLAALAPWIDVAEARAAAELAAHETVIGAAASLAASPRPSAVPGAPKAE